MKSLKNLRKGLAIVLCVAMLLGDSILLQAAQVQTVTAGATVSEAVVEPEAEVAEPATEGEPLVAAEEEVPAAEAVEEEPSEEEPSEKVADAAPEEEVAAPAAETEEAEEEEKEDATDKTFSAEVDGTTFTVIAKEGTFAEEVTLQVTKVEITEALQAELDERAIEEQKAIESATAYDVKFVNAAGEEVEPAQEVQVTVSTPEVNAGDDASVYHFDEAAASVADMSATVENSGDVAFDTDHFSTYVIVNKGQNTVTVKIHHVDQAGNEIYSMDERKIAVGARVVDFNKAANWDVSTINRDSVNGNQISAETLANGITTNMEIWVHYIPKNQTFVGDVTAWDYTVEPNSQYVNGSWTDGYKLSINTEDNYKAQSGYNKNRASLTVGKTDQNYSENKHDDSYTYGTHRNQKINDYGEGNNAVKYGIIKGLDANGNVEFNVNQPGIFSTAPSVGKYVYNNNEYSLKFNQTGDTYELAAFHDNDTGSEVRAGSDFFLMQNAPSRVQDGANSSNQNDFFGMRYDVQFTIGDYIGDLKYRFSGDDDMWVILDGKEVVIDLGGIHQVQTQEVDLWQYIEGGKANCDRTKEHKLTILYLERGAVASNCEMKFTLPNAQVVDYTTPLANLDITKIDEADENPLAGATFKLQYSDASIERTVTTGEDGKAHFGDLIEGTYTLTETAAPDEYELPTESWVVKVTVSTDGKTATATLYEADGKTKVANNTITNKKINIPVIPTYNKSKTAKVTDYDNREYEITLEANSTTTTTTTSHSGETVDVVMVLDISGSMRNQDVEVVVSTSYEKRSTYRFQSDNQWRLNGNYYALYDNEYYPLVERKSGGRYYYSYTDKDNNKHELASDEYTYLYVKQTKKIARIDALKNSAGQFLTSISAKSPNSNVGIISFEGQASTVYGMNRIGNDPSAAIEAVNGMIVDRGITSTDKGLSAAKDMLSSVSSNGRKKVVILFTDGEPTGTNGQYSSSVAGRAKTAATDIKKTGATIYTVGFALTTSNAKWLRESIASSSDCAFTTDTADGLTLIFEGISQSITKNYDIENATIVDVVDPRFEIVGTPEGATVKDNVVTWTEQTIPYKGSWKKTIKVRAKANFLGGNKVPTNVAPESGIKISEEGELDPFENQPTVNVKLLNLTGAEDEEIVFLGDEINALGLDETLAKAIKVNDTVLFNGEYTVNYAYPGTSDVLGTITFTKKAEGEGAAFTKHNAEYIGSPAERYTVTAEYKPLKVSERPAELAAPAANAGTEVTTSATGKAVHKVKVVAGSLVIKKTISNKDYKAAYGDPVFTYKITNKTNGKVYYKTLRFTGDTTGIFKTTWETTITGLPKGDYEVIELDTMGFNFKSLSVDGYNKSVVDERGSFTLEMNHDKATAAYENKLAHTRRDTDTDVVKNTFVINDKNGSTSNVDNDATQDVGKHTTLVISNEGGNQ